MGLPNPLDSYITMALARLAVATVALREGEFAPWDAAVWEEVPLAV